MRLLVVEDEAPKLRNIRELALELNLFDELIEVRSVGSALGALRQDRFDLIILDMSLPTFDIVAGESGGRPQGFGGQEVLRYMDRYAITTPVIVATAFEAFTEKGKAIGLKDLEKALQGEHPDSFRGIVFYNTMFSKWRDDLRGLIKKVLETE